MPNVSYQGESFKWDKDWRAHLWAELDAYYARLCGLSRDELRHVLDPQKVYGSDFPGETFRVLTKSPIFRLARPRHMVLPSAGCGGRRRR